MAGTTAIYEQAKFSSDLAVIIRVAFFERLLMILFKKAHVAAKSFNSVLVSSLCFSHRLVCARLTFREQARPASLASGSEDLSQAEGYPFAPA